MDIEPNPRLTLIEQTEAIHESSHIPKDRDHLAELLEPPVKDACLQLYDKNIRTIMSSANKKDMSTGYGYISMDYDQLSEENKRIAEEIGAIEKRGEGGTVARIKFPISPSTTVDDISKASQELADKFVKQKMTWVPRYTIAQINELYLAGEDEFGPDDYIGMGYYYDAGKKLLYMSEEHFKKANEPGFEV
jgi:hypothetical protein